MVLTTPCFIDFLKQLNYLTYVLFLEYFLWSVSTSWQGLAGLLSTGLLLSKVIQLGEESPKSRGLSPHGEIWR